jgi:hypothetical protein
MKHIDITKQVLALHEEDVFKQMMSDVQKDLEEASSSLQSEIDMCLGKINSQQIASSDNVVSLKSKSNNVVAFPFAETELLAASGKSLSDWFSQPMNFGGAGFVLDVRRVLGSDNEVDLYLTPNQTKSTEMKESLQSYLGKSLSISVINNGKSLLNATLYVDESGSSAEGSGYLITANDKDDVKGKISINILVEDN